MAIDNINSNIYFSMKNNNIMLNNRLLDAVLLPAVGTERHAACYLR
jgi:hypothetical protein